MKKCTCTVIYRYVNKHYEPIKIIVKHKHENILLYDERDHTDKKHKFKYFQELYACVLAILKSNNFYVHKWEMFESKWYDIDFIDTDTYSVNRYAYE